MGEVWKATDNRFDRTVSIKVLPPHLSDEPKLREPFDREALADRLKPGALALERALRFGIEIAGALDESHRARYLAASSFARNYCSSLVRRFLRHSRMSDLLEDLRLFYRLSQCGKIGHISRVVYAS